MVTVVPLLEGKRIISVESLPYDSRNQGINRPLLCKKYCFGKVFVTSAWLLMQVKLNYLSDEYS